MHRRCPTNQLTLGVPKRADGCPLPRPLPPLLGARTSRRLQSPRSSRTANRFAWPTPLKLTHNTTTFAKFLSVGSSSNGMALRGRVPYSVSSELDAHL